MGKRFILLLWLLGILLPVAWIVQSWLPAQTAFNWLFGPLWMHIVMHAWLFAVLAYLVAQMLGHRLGAGRYRWALCGALSLVLLAALGQEAIQLAYKARAWCPDEALDLTVDLAGCGLGLLAFWWRAGIPPFARSRRS
jgi:hypothetical protein